MFNLMSIKGYLYGTIGIIFVVCVVYFLNNWHYAVISNQERYISKQEKTIKSQALTINNLSVQIQQMVEENKVIGFESYFEGIADANNTVISDKLIF